MYDVYVDDNMDHDGGDTLVADDTMMADDNTAPCTTGCSETVHFF